MCGMKVAQLLNNNLCDMELLESASIKYNYSVYGTVLTSTAFRNRFIISTRHTSVYSGLFEYTTEGKLLHTILDTDAIGPLHTNPYTGEIVTKKQALGGRHVSLLFAASDHILACLDNGTLIVFYAQNKANPGLGSNKSTQGIVSPHDFDWISPIYLPDYHHTGVYLGCQTTEANMDIFYTVDKYEVLCVTMVENGGHVRTLSSPPLSHVSLSSMQIFDNKLYASFKSGELKVYDLNSFYQASILPSGTSMHKHEIQLSYPTVFNSMKENSISSMALMCSHGLMCHMLTEDDVRRAQECELLTTHANKQRGVMKSASTAVAAPVVAGGHCHHVVEGHLVLVGGGDSDPRVKILRPIYHYDQGYQNKQIYSKCVMQELSALVGHTRAVTCIAVDLAGRHVVTASTGDHTVRLWDGLLFTCYQTFENINVHSVSIAYNALLVTSYKAPYMRLFRVYYDEPVPVAAVNKTAALKQLRKNGIDTGSAVSPGELPDNGNEMGTDSVGVYAQLILREKEKQQPGVQSRRSVSWSYAVLKNTLQLPPQLLYLYSQYSYSSVSSGYKQHPAQITDKNEYFHKMIRQSDNPNYDNPIYPSFPYTSSRDGDEFREDMEYWLDYWKKRYYRCNASAREKEDYIGNALFQRQYLHSAPGVRDDAPGSSLADLLASKWNSFSPSSGTKRKGNKQPSSSAFLSSQALNVVNKPGARTPRSKSKLIQATRAYQGQAWDEMNTSWVSPEVTDGEEDPCWLTPSTVATRQQQDDQVLEVEKEKGGSQKTATAVSTPETLSPSRMVLSSTTDSNQIHSNSGLSVRKPRDLFRYSDDEDDEEEEEHLNKQWFDHRQALRVHQQRIVKPVLMNAFDNSIYDDESIIQWNKQKKEKQKRKVEEEKESAALLTINKFQSDKSSSSTGSKRLYGNVNTNHKTTTNNTNNANTSHKTATNISTATATTATAATNTTNGSISKTIHGKTSTSIVT